jgi:hypothetical protein
MKNTSSELYPKFRTKANKLTAYAFICGYIEEKTINQVELSIVRLVLNAMSNNDAKAEALIF